MALISSSGSQAYVATGYLDNQHNTTQSFSASQPCTINQTTSVLQMADGETPAPTPTATSTPKTDRERQDQATDFYIRTRRRPWHMDANSPTASHGFSEFLADLKHPFAALDEKHDPTPLMIDSAATAGTAGIVAKIARAGSPVKAVAVGAVALLGGLFATQA